MGLGLEQHRRRMDPSTNEPLFTNCTRDFIGTLDYIFYSGIPMTFFSHEFYLYFILEFCMPILFNSFVTLNGIFEAV